MVLASLTVTEDTTFYDLLCALPPHLPGHYEVQFRCCDCTFTVRTDSKIKPIFDIFEKNGYEIKFILKPIQFSVGEDESDEVSQPSYGDEIALIELDVTFVGHPLPGTYDPSYEKSSSDSQKDSWCMTISSQSGVVLAQIILNKYTRCQDIIDALPPNLFGRYDLWVKFFNYISPVQCSTNVMRIFHTFEEAGFNLKFFFLKSEGCSENLPIDCE